MESGSPKGFSLLLPRRELRLREALGPVEGHSPGISCWHRGVLCPGPLPPSLFTLLCLGGVCVCTHPGNSG